MQVLLGNRGKEVLGYIYDYPVVIDNLVRHVSNKSVCEVLEQLLSTHEALSEIDSDEIRISFVNKIVDRMLPDNTELDIMEA